MAREAADKQRNNRRIGISLINRELAGNLINNRITIDSERLISRRITDG